MSPVDHQDPELDPADGIVINGVNGATGEYLLPELSIEDIAKMARGEPLDIGLLAELKGRAQAAGLGFESLGPVDGDQADLGQVGWGVIFGSEDQDTEAILAALDPLLQHRKAQCEVNGDRLFKVFKGAAGCKPDELQLDWRARHGVSAGNPNFGKVPYFLLLIGSPQHVPFTFEFEMNVAHASGRLDLATPADYERYAQTVVEVETGGDRPKTAHFFGVANDHDRATQMSSKRLVEPAAKEFADAMNGWTVGTSIAADATKAKLVDLLGKGSSPSLLVTASHGMGFPKGATEQRDVQGAILCQDWNGPLKDPKKPEPEHYVAASDIDDDADVKGMVAFLFACFGAGTPQYDGFVQNAGRLFKEIASEGFSAALPRRLLSHPKGSALSVVAHVDRAWGYSFIWPGAGDQIQIFTEAFLKLASGLPVGVAMERFSLSWAELCTVINQEKQRPVPMMDDRKLAGTWTACNDRRSYVVLGDPATCLV